MKAEDKKAGVALVRLLVLVGFCLAATAGIAAVDMALRTAQAEAWVTHSFEVRADISHLLSALERAETGQRGYLLTGEESYLAPLKETEGLVQASFDRLLALTADNAQQQQRLAALKSDIRARLDLIQSSVALMQQGQRDKAVAVVASNQGKSFMDKIDQQLDAFGDAEFRLLRMREADAARLRTWLLVLICTSLSAAMLLAGLLGYSAQKTLNQLRERTAELEAEAKLRRKTEETLQHAQKMEAVGQLTGGIAHDFNNLLTIIIGNLDTARRRLTEFPLPQTTIDLITALKPPLDMALQGSRSAAQLTHRLLAFSRRQTLEPARLDLNRLISGMSDMLSRTLGETISVETILAGGLWPSFADANQLESALLNLCVNARDAMPDGGRLTIETANTYLDNAYASQFGDVTAGQYVQLSVADTGSGIQPDVLDRVFEPFFTTKQGGEGSGLGLAMVHGFVKQSGGHIRVYSELGHGTTVKIYLPRMMQAEQSVLATPLAKPMLEQAAQRARSHETILLVEDNAGVRDYACAVLEELGYAVFKAADASEALRLIEEGVRIDLLFTDVVLPGDSGRQLADQVLALRPGLPVLFTTGYTRNAIIHHGRLDPGVQLLGKPYTQQDLARKIRELLDARRARLEQPSRDVSMQEQPEEENGSARIAGPS